jgi:hypothetical protein
MEQSKVSVAPRNKGGVTSVSEGSSAAVEVISKNFAGQIGGLTRSAGCQAIEYRALKRRPILREFRRSNLLGWK